MIALYEDNEAKQLAIKNKRVQKKVAVAKFGTHLGDNTLNAYNSRTLEAQNSAKAKSAASLFYASWSAFKSGMARIYSAYKERKADQLAAQYLMQLDDHMLKDMGLTREDLHQFNRGHLSLDALANRRKFDSQNDIGR